MVMWEECTGLSQRTLDVINQCRYLASKKGLSIKELRKSLREDEALQRQLVRQEEMKSQMKPTNSNGSGDSNCSVYPSWFAHMDSHGMLYSQYNLQPYGQNYTCDETIFRKSSSTHTSCNCNICQSNGLFNQQCSEETLMHQQPPLNITSISSSDEQNDNDDTLVSLLYAANRQDKSKINTFTQSNSTRFLANDTRRCGGVAGLIDPDDILKPKCNDSPVQYNPLVGSESFLECSLPVRKMATHNLATVKDENEDDDFSVILANDELTCSVPESDTDGEDDNEEASEASEIVIINELDKPKVVSPLIKKAETAFANLQNKESLFGNMDDFGYLMNKANKLL